MLIKTEKNTRVKRKSNIVDDCSILKYWEYK